MTELKIKPAEPQDLIGCAAPGIEVIDLGQIYREPSAHCDDPFQPHRVDYFCFICIDRGSGSHWVDGVSHPYQDGSLIFINRDQHHAFDRSDSPQGKLVVITPAFFSACAANIRNSYFVPFHLSLMCSPVLQMAPSDSQNCHGLLEQLIVAIAEADQDTTIVELLFAALVLKLSRQRSLQRPAADDLCRRRFTEFLNLVENEFHQSRDATVYAGKMHLSYKSLNQLCKRCSGRTAKQIIDFRLNLEITRKLRMNSDCIQSIAFEMGFDDITNFVRYFKRHNNVTPANYRAACQ
ncbi:helix-turn-helix domain-containing protein [Ferrimonas balearica]|uniref:helix-turn-helix domain-containing protein n=1 Tax=Ferrimonas balearica TaxID=44012 RepID=UPI001F2A1591|nr:helix-turn-helix domain-containing protein [Ferrimonas balearica]MBY6016457.1 helix-turn-helix transcriptional regulator [Halomonas denitrificans]MBY6095272.1 helix-turn-helix transcriptional regulator [Ferrimonas balearica]